MIAAPLLTLLLTPGPGPAPQEVAERATDARSGHGYLRTRAVLSIHDALALAQLMGGTLVAIGSAEEEEFLLENFGASEGYWIGLEFPREAWNTGEALEHSHWAPGEPAGGSAEPFTVMNWGDPGAWGDSAGDVVSDRYRALIEFADGAIPAEPAELPTTRRPQRCVLLCAIQDLRAKDLEASRHPTLNALWKRSAYTFDAGADGSADPLAGLGMVLWGVGSARSKLSSAAPAQAARRGTENLLARLERAHPDIATAALLDDPSLTGILLDGRVDLRVSNASPRRGGSAEPVREALSLPAPLCVVAAWTRISVPGAEESNEGARARELAAIDSELGALLAVLEARPTRAEEEWWIALCGLTPAPAKKGKAAQGDLRARTAVPLCLLVPGVPAGVLRSEVQLVDLVPSALAFLGIEPRRSAGLDGRVLALDVPPAYGANLLVNGGAEAQLGWGPAEFPLLTGWRQLAPFRLGRHGADELGPPARGSSYFQGARGSSLARAEQTIDLAALAADIDRGAVLFRLAGWLGSGGQGQATIECALEFLSEQEKVLERAVLGPVGQGERRAELGATKGVPLAGLLEREVRGKVPRRARAARVILLAEGPDVGQTLADELSLELALE